MIIEWVSDDVYWDRRYFGFGNSWNYLSNPGLSGPWYVEAGHIYVAGAVIGQVR